MIITLQNHCKSPPFASNTDYTTKEVNWQGAIPPTTLEVGESLLDYVEISQKQTLRHEIVHAFFDESGLASSSLGIDGPWAKNEEMVDWFALQGPKIYKAWQEAGAI